MTIVIKHRENNSELPLIERILQARGVSNDSLQFTLAKLADYSSLKGITDATRLLAEAIKNEKKILIIGDFDVDGATSTALAVHCLRQMGAQWVHYLVPNRFEYGYGLSPEIVNYAQKNYQPELIVTVDNGISSLEGVERANSFGIDVLVTDHHLAADQLPKAAAIVNPNQPGCPFPSKSACGCTVIFYVLCSLRRYLLDQDQLTVSDSPNMAQYLDLVALATVADVVPMDENNRILVEQGLRRIRKGHGRPGIQALLTVSNKDAAQLTSKDFGFALGPRLNAAGRLDDISIGIDCLLAENHENALKIAKTLDELNQDRKHVEQSMQQDALAQLNSLSLDDHNLPNVICLYNEQWHQGVVGLLASRLKEKYFRPVIAFAKSDDGEELKGSARSIQGLHLRDALDIVAKKNPNILKKFGGHAMAAGLSIYKDDFYRFKEAFELVVSSLINDELLTHLVVTDGSIDAHELTFENAQRLKMCAPWGQQFPEPLFDNKFEVVNQRIVGDKHLKMTLKIPGTTTILDAIAFNVDTKVWPKKTINEVHAVFEMDCNFFRNNWSLQLIIRHLLD